MIKTFKIHKSWLLYCVVLSTVSVFLQGQTGKISNSKYGHGKDSIRCIRNLSLYREYCRTKDYNKALGFWRVTFDECPRSSKNMYIDGAKMYKWQLDQTFNIQRKRELIDTLILVYDRRLEYFGDTGNVRGRQGGAILKYSIDDNISYLKKAYSYLNESLELLGTSVSHAVLPALFTASALLYTENELTSVQLINDYFLVSETIDKIIKKTKFKGRLLKIKQSIDEDFIRTAKLECEEIVTHFNKEFESKKTDISFLKTLSCILKERSCTSNELYYQSLVELFKHEPTAKTALQIAWLASNNNQHEIASVYYEEALKLVEDKNEKAECYYELAKAWEKIGDNVKSRESAYKAVELKSGFGEPYILIGHLYANSKNDCEKFRKLELPNSVYWLAVDMFNKAKSVDPGLTDRVNSLISNHLPHFPNKEEAFFIGIKEGDNYYIGCWINETTKARF